MSPSSRCTRRTAAALLTLFAALLSAGGAAAAEGEGGWRATYDLVMLWVNFAILAFFIVKYGRAPLKKFLEEESRKTAAAIRQAEEAKVRVDRELAETGKAVADSRARLAAVKARIIADGEQRRKEAIEAARREGDLLLARAQDAAAHELTEAGLRLKAELVDAAVAAALARLPAELRPEDHARLIDRFIESA